MLEVKFKRHQDLDPIGADSEINYMIIQTFKKYMINRISRTYICMCNDRHTQDWANSPLVGG